MRAPAALTCALALLAASLSGQPLHFGTPLTFTAPESGGPGGSIRIVNAWMDNGEPVVIVQRNIIGIWATFRAPLRADGSIDNTRAVALDLPPGLAAVDRRGNELFAVVQPSDTSILEVIHLDAQGRTLSAAPKVITSAVVYHDLAVSCNAARCFIKADGDGMFLDPNDRMRAFFNAVQTAAAGGDAVLVERCPGVCKVDFLDVSGRVLSTFTPPARIDDIIYDGFRFIAAGVSSSTQLLLWSIDPVNGTWSSAHSVASLSPYPSASPRLAWNGSMYGVALVMGPPPAFGFFTYPSLQTLLVDSSFVALDAPRYVEDVGSSTPVRIVGRPDGFAVLRSDIGPGGHAWRLHADGVIDPPPPATAMFLRDKQSQGIMAGASSRTSYLAVWTEDDGQRTRLVAARRARTGELLDTKAITIADQLFSYAPSVVAASDGDSYLVAWADYGAHAALIDAAGAVHPVTLIPGPQGYDCCPASAASLTFANGAYQFAAMAAGKVDVFTISSAGTNTLRQRVEIDGPGTVGATFDGRTLAAAWSSGTLRTLVKDVTTGRTSGPNDIVLPSSGAQSAFDVSIRPDGAGGYLLLYGSDLPSSTPYRHVRTIARLSPDGKLVAGSILGYGNFTIDVSLLRIGRTWFATWTDLTFSETTGNLYFRAFVPFDAATLASSSHLDLPSRPYVDTVAPGWDGEALLLYATIAPTELGPIALATVQPIAGAPRGRPARH